MKMIHRSAQQVADYFQVYMCRDSDGTWRGFRKKPVVKILHLVDDFGKPVDCGFWSTPEDDPIAAITFKRGIYDDRHWTKSLTYPKPPKKNNNKGNFQKKNNYQKGNNFQKNYQKKEPVENKGPLDEETANKIKDLFKD